MSKQEAGIGGVGAMDGIARRAGVADYFELMKPRVMSLVVFTALVGLLIAPGTIGLLHGAAAIFLIAVGAGASGALNMWYDADIDGRMARTSKRPIPLGRITARQSLVFGSVLSVFSIIALGMIVNTLSAALLALTIGFYLFIYTIWLKRRTPQNIVIGGAAGAFPPMIAWAAVTGDIALGSITLFAIIFFWTPPHFWALSLYKASEYEDVGVPMLPVVAGIRETQRQILIYALIMIPVAITPALVGIASIYFGVFAFLLTAAFAALGFQLYRVEEADVERPARRVFLYSLIYLFGMFAALLVDYALVKFI